MAEIYHTTATSTLANCTRPMELFAIVHTSNISCNYRTTALNAQLALDAYFMNVRREIIAITVVVGGNLLGKARRSCIECVAAVDVINGPFVVMWPATDGCPHSAIMEFPPPK